MSTRFENQTAQKGFNNLFTFVVHRFILVTQDLEQHSEWVTTLEIFACIKINAEQFFHFFFFSVLFYYNYWCGLKCLKHSGSYCLRLMTQLPDCFHPPAASLNNQQAQISWTASSQRLKWVKILWKGYWLLCMDFYLSKEWNAIRWPNYSLIFAAAVGGHASAAANARVVSWKCHRCRFCQSDKSASAFVRRNYASACLRSDKNIGRRRNPLVMCSLGTTCDFSALHWCNHKVRCTREVTSVLGDIFLLGLLLL